MSAQMNLEFAILAGALTAIYAGMKNIMDTVYVINAKRDLILDIDESGLRLDRTRKNHLLTTDVYPMIVGLTLFLTVYTSAFFLLGIAVHWNLIENVHSYLAWFLYAAGGASLYALWIVVTKNALSYRIMRDYVDRLPGDPGDWTVPSSLKVIKEIETQSTGTLTNKQPGDSKDSSANEAQMAETKSANKKMQPNCGSGDC